MEDSLVEYETLQNALKKELEEKDLASNLDEFKEFDNDYYYRKLPPTPFVTCVLPGVAMAMCAPKDYEELRNATKFCNDVNYSHICIPIEHFLWPTWTVERKDFEIETQVA